MRVGTDIVSVMVAYKVCSKRSETDFFTRLWVHFGTSLFAGWWPWTPSLPERWDGANATLSPSWASVEESRVPAPCYSHRRKEGMALVCGNKNAAGSRVRWKLYRANHHGRQDVGLRVRPGDETSVFAMEFCWFPETKESAPGAVKSQSHAHCFLWYGGHCSLWVRFTRPNLKPTVLSTSFETSERLAVSRKRQQKRVAGAWALRHDSAPAHTAHSIQVLFWQVIAFLSFSSSDMAPCDFWLFPQLKTVLKGKRFEDIDATKKNAKSTLNTIPKDSFEKCFQQWQDRWKQCVSSQGEYFEIYWIFFCQ